MKKHEKRRKTGNVVFDVQVGMNQVTFYCLFWFFRFRWVILFHIFISYEDIKVYPQPVTYGFGFLQKRSDELEKCSHLHFMVDTLLHQFWFISVYCVFNHGKFIAGHHWNKIFLKFQQCFKSKLIVDIFHLFWNFFAFWWIQQFNKNPFCLFE